MTKVKIVDVAERAGVSKSTVSQYLNGRFDYMSERTRSKVEAAIKELNYVPNPNARSLKSDKTYTIGVIVRDISGFYTGRVIRGIDDYCKDSKYNVLIYNTDFDPEAEARSLQALRQMRVDGIIIASSGKSLNLISEYIESGFPLVQFQLEYDQCESNLVVSDYRKASFEATEYLIGLGHKRICFLTQKFEGIRSREERYLGYLSALEKHGIELDPGLVRHWDRETRFHTSLAQIIDENQPTAFFSQHLAITTDLIQGFDKLGVEIPRDMSLLGFDEIPMVEHFKVPITVVRQDPYQVGKESARLLLQSINQGKKQTEKTKVTIPCTLVERESCREVGG